MQTVKVVRHDGEVEYLPFAHAGATRLGEHTICSHVSASIDDHYTSIVEFSTDTGYLRTDHGETDLLRLAPGELSRIGRVTNLGFSEPPPTAETKARSESRCMGAPWTT